MTIKTKLIAGSGLLVIAGGTLAISAAAYAIAYGNSATPAATPAAVSTRLDTAKLKVCTLREKVIDNTLTRISDRGSRHLALITDVATKTEAYYTSSGKVLSNYDTLLATVNADQSNAQAAVAQVKTDSTSFSCGGTDPVGTLQSFKTDVKAEVTTLQDYKLSVKNLVSGVRND